METCWRVRGRSGCVFTCAIYQGALGRLELRVEHNDAGEDTLVFCQPVGNMNAARELAGVFRETVLTGPFDELLD